MARGVIGALLGGIIGAAIWAAVSYFTGYEVGWIAWGVGGLVGLGMRVGAGDSANAQAGAVAAGIALAAIALGKWLTVTISVGNVLDIDDLAISSLADVVLVEAIAQGRPLEPVSSTFESLADAYPASVWNEAVRQWDALGAAEQDRLRDLPMRAYDDYVTAHGADLIAMERTDRGETVAWPRGMELGVAWHQLHYPADVWQEATARLEEMPPAEYAQFVEDLDAYYKEQYEASIEQIRSEATQSGFSESFSPYDILWAVLALMTAFRVASTPPPVPVQPLPQAGEDPFREDPPPRF